MKLRVLKELVDMTTRTIEGQALDIGWARDDRFDLTVEDYLLMANHKTAFYSGAVPLAIGSIIGGGSETQTATLRAFGLASGLAFQIQDDVLNLVGTREATKKDFRSDITEGKRTLGGRACVGALAEARAIACDSLGTRRPITTCSTRRSRSCERPARSSSRTASPSGSSSTPRKRLRPSCHGARREIFLLRWPTSS